MARIEGRGITKPRVAEVYMGADLVVRIDDKQNHEFWLTLAVTPAELAEVVARYLAWLKQSRQVDALKAFEEALG